MKRLCQVAVIMMAVWVGGKAHAACTTAITAGMTSAQQQTAIHSCSSGSTAAYPAGSYSNTTTISVPCGVSIAGPAVPLTRYTGGDGYARYGYAPTAIISSTASPAFTYGSCSTAQSFEYMEVNGNRPSSGGQAIYASSSGGVNNLTIAYNYFHGNNWNGSGECYGCELILFDGNGSAADAGDTVSWNRLGANGDCAEVMSNFSYGGYTGDGGYCTAVGWHNDMTSLTVNNNFIYYQEEGIKGHEGGSDFNCVNCLVQSNDISNFHRIAIETQEQGTGGGAAVGTVITFQYNSIHDPYTPGNGTFGISSNNAYPGSNSNPSINTDTSNDLSNVVIDNVAYATGSPSAWVGLGIEFWSMHTGSVGNNNLLQGEWVNTFMLGPDGAMTASNNHIQSSFGWGGSNTPSKCSPATPGSYGWFNSERSPANTAAGSGNQCDFFDGSAQTSAAAVISPASGSFSGSQIVTFTDPGYTSGVGPLGNTGIWYTTDGSTPVPGSGTAQYISTGGSIAVTATTTVKAVGMWGAANQPASYPTGPHNTGGTGYGFVPSAQVSATYTLSGTPTAAVPVFTPATESFSGTLSVTAASSTPGATLYCTNNGVTPTTSSPVYTGPFTITATTTVQCIAAASGYGNSGVGSGTYAAAASPAITSGYQGNPGSINTLAVGATPIQQVAYAYYTDGNTRTLPDSFGNTAGWSSSNSGVLSVSSTGLISCLAPSSTTVYSLVVANPGAIALNHWGWTCTGSAGPSLSSITLATTGGVGSIGYHATNQILATCHYSDGSSTACNIADSHGNAVSSWASSAPGLVSISGSGLATGVAIGSANLTATVAGTISTPALALGVTSTATLVNAYLGPASGSCTPAGTVQFAAYCHYAAGADQSCTVTDVYGDAVSGWVSGTPTSVTIGNVGSAHPGLASCIAVGSSSITAMVNSALTSSAAPVTVATAGITLTGVSLSTAGGVTGLAVGSTNQLKATCTYSDGSTTVCTTTDAHGNVASGWTSAHSGFATVSGSGLVTGVAAGLTTFTASAGGVSSAAMPLTVSLIPAGTYTITITGPVTMTGTVHF